MVRSFKADILSVSPKQELWQGACIWSISFETTPNYFVILTHQCSTTVSLVTYLYYSLEPVGLPCVTFPCFPTMKRQGVFLWPQDGVVVQCSLPTPLPLPQLCTMILWQLAITSLDSWGERGTEKMKFLVKKWKIWLSQVLNSDPSICRRAQ